MTSTTTDLAIAREWIDERFALASPAAFFFAPSRFVSQKVLADHHLAVEFVPLPFALYRIERA